MSAFNVCPIGICAGDSNATSGTSSGSVETASSDGTSDSAPDPDPDSSSSSTSGPGTGELGEAGESSAGDDGAPYGDPALGCLADEVPVPFPGVAGDLCSASCVTTADCPPLDPPASAFPQCALALNGSAVATNCILACDFTANPSQCPAGSTCKDVGQGGVVGTCTYP